MDRAITWRTDLSVSYDEDDIDNDDFEDEDDFGDDDDFNDEDVGSAAGEH